MLLTADIGNTTISLGLFDDNVLLEDLRLNSDKELSQDKYEQILKTLFKDKKITDCIIGSVVKELSGTFKSAVDRVFRIKSFLLETNSKTGLEVKLKNPKELGADRIANAVAGYMLYEKPVIVVDFGTATSFDIVNEDAQFLGGLIAPGLSLQMKALSTFTSKLPKVDIVMSDKAIGDDTESAILSGVIRGTACMIDGMIAQCEKELGKKATVVATGGYCGLIRSYLQRPFDTINPTLTLEGLRYLHYLNTEAQV